MALEPALPTSLIMLKPTTAFMTLARPLTVSRWLFAVAGLIVLMVIVGGITRLTESGLSITSWKPISGTIPPLNDAQWRAEFDAYKQIPEYTQLNAGMTMAGFKAIFFWEYAHRLLGRIIGLAFALPLLYYAARRWIPRGYGWRLTALFALGATQGVIGWWMVSSGLSERTDVSHVRLAVHLLTALTILAGLVWTALDLRALHRNPLAVPARLGPVAIVALVGLYLQLLYGAFTAGLDAGYAFSSWPMMGDEWYPAAAPMLPTVVQNAVDNPIMVQFVHRWLAFVTAAGLVWLAARAVKAGSPRAGVAVILLVGLQISLGVATLMTGVALPIAIAHQANAALLLIATVWAAHVVGERGAVLKPVR